MQAQTIGQRFLLSNMPQWRWQFCYMAHVRCDIIKTFVSQLQTVVQWIRGVHLRQILLVGYEDAFFVVYNSIGHSQQNLVAQGFRNKCKRTTGCLGLLKCFNQFHKV